MKILTDKEIEDKAYEIMMTYLTEGNSGGDFKKSTIGADSNIAWWIKGAKWYRNLIQQK